jgi:maltose O-acetyltransferase
MMMNSFTAGNAQEMVDFKFAVMKKLQQVNDETIRPDDTYASLSARRMAVAKEIFGRIGSGIKIEANFFLIWGCNLFIGDNVYMNRG